MSSTPTTDATDFAVVLATRNRGDLLRRALTSVLAQQDVRLQAIVVDDGSSPEHAATVALAVAGAGGRAELLRLPSRAAGHGPSFARNSGAAMSCSTFIAFLDDDDEWTDPGHLARCLASMSAGPVPADLLFGDQRGVLPNGSEHPGPLWFRGVEQQLGAPVDAQGAYLAPVQVLLDLGALCHLNTTVLRRELFDQLGGFDERMRFEEDRDLCLRAIDRAQRILYQPRSVADHYVPDPAKRANVSTAMTDNDKRLAQLHMYDKALLGCQRPESKLHARQSKGKILKRLTDQMEREGRPRDAQAFRLQALATDFTFKWLAVTALSGLRSLGHHP